MLPTIMLMVSILVGLASNSWLAIWMMLELNTLAFCSIKEKEKKKNNHKKVKYFIVQSISSSVMASSMLMKSSLMNLNLSKTITVTALVMKLGAIPMHSWYYDMIKNMSWKTMLTLMTVQKIYGIYLMSYTKKEMTIMIAMMGIVVSTVMQMNKMNFLDIMAISSMFNMGCLMLCCVLSINTTMKFMAVYMMAVLKVMATSKMKNFISKKSHSLSNTKKTVNLASLVNLAGIPPSAGFLAKWFLAMELISKGMTSILTLMLTSSAMNLYVYTRSYISSMMKTSKNKQISWTTNLKSKSIMMISTIVLMIMFASN